VKTRARIVTAVSVAALILILIAVAVGYRALERNFGHDTSVPAPIAPATGVVAPHPSFLYGRVTIASGATYEGRVRWGRDQEAFWGDYFNGVKATNPWANHVPREYKGPDTLKIFGIAIGNAKMDFGRPFMMRFGDIARIERPGRDVRVTLKSGTIFDLDYSSLNDFDDGVRIWDASKGVLDISSPRLRSVDLLPAPTAAEIPHRLHGTVRTRQGDFTGFVQWNRNKSIGTDELAGRSDAGDRVVRFDQVRSIARQSGESSRVTLLDGREIVLSGTRDTGASNLGIYVDDSRYGRVLVSWDAFDGLDFSAGTSGPSYSDFQPGRPLTGTITTRAGRRLAGRLVYDLDESETTETLDAPDRGVDYTIPFGLIASIELSGRQTIATVTLHTGEELRLERRGDLGESNGGMLIFVDGQQQPEYVPWSDVQRIDFER